jgi:hypothetical protein
MMGSLAHPQAVPPWHSRCFLPKVSTKAGHFVPAYWNDLLQKESVMSRLTSEAVEHSEGGFAKPIEEYTARLPSDTFLWLAGGSILGSLGLMLSGRRHDALFVGQWAPTFLLLGVYNKIVKVAGSDRISGSGRSRL